MEKGKNQQRIDWIDHDKKGLYVYTFRTRPRLPEALQECFQIFESKVLLVHFLPIKRLAETPVSSIGQSPPQSHTTKTIDSPTRITPSKSLQSYILLLLRPNPLLPHSLPFNPSLFRPPTRNPLRSQQRALYTFQENLIMQTRACRTAKRDGQVHHIGVLGDPLVGLARAHGPAYNAVEVVYLEMLCDQVVLSADVVVDRDFGEGVGVGCIGRGGGLAVSEEGADDDEELGMIFNGSTWWLSNVVYLFRI